KTPATPSPAALPPCEFLSLLAFDRFESRPNKPSNSSRRESAVFPVPASRSSPPPWCVPAQRGNPNPPRHVSTGHPRQALPHTVPPLSRPPGPPRTSTSP